MKKLILILAVVMMLGLTSSAYSMNVYTLTVPQLLSLTEVYDYPTNVASLLSVTNNLDGSVSYTTLINDNAEQFRWQLLGSPTPSVTDLTGYTHFGLFFDNLDNNDPTQVSVFVYAGASSTRYLSSWLELDNGASGTALLDLSVLGGNINNIKNIGLGLAYDGNTPAGGGKYQGDLLHVMSAAVPEPTSMLLLGMGILGLFGLGRKKIKV